jgi:hypothetical protein
VHQTGYIVLADAKGLGFGTRDSVNSLPTLLGSDSFQSFTENAAQAAVGGSGQTLGDFRSAGDIEMDTVLVVRIGSCRMILGVTARLL